MKNERENLGSLNQNTDEVAPENTATENLFYLDQSHFSVNNRRISFYGVNHVPETFAAHQVELQMAINKAGVVVLESAPEASHFISPESGKLLSRYFAEVMGEKIPFEQAMERLSGLRSYVFYKSIEEEAAKAKKPVVTIDPATSFYEDVGIMDLFNASTKADVYKEVVFLGTALGLTGLALEKIIQKIQNRQTAFSSQPTTRRMFLNGLIGFSLLAFSSWSAGKIEEGASEGRDLNVFGRANNPLGFSLYSFHDFRDVVIAKGLDYLTRTEQTDDPVVVIYGGAHRKSVVHYLTIQLERDLKYYAYAPFRAQVNPTLRKYEFDDQTGWNKVLQIDI